MLLDTQAMKTVLLDVASLEAEQDLAASRGREQALQEQLLKVINDSKERLKKQMHLCSEVEATTWKASKRNQPMQDCSKSAAFAEDRANLLEQKLSHLSDSIERERKRFSDQLLQFQQESKLLVSRIRTDLEKMEFRANNAEKESAMTTSSWKRFGSSSGRCLLFI